MSNLRAQAKKFHETFPNLKSSDELLAFIKEYYGANVVQYDAGQEDKARKGLDAVLAAETGFFGMLDGGHFKGTKINSIDVDESTGSVFVDSVVQAQFKGAPAPIPFHQLTHQVWKDGKLVKEVFWQLKQA